MLEQIPHEQINRVQKELRAMMPEEPEPANVRAVMDLGATTFFVFRDRGYVVEPVPYRVGFRLEVLHRRLLKTAIDTEEGLAAFTAIVAETLLLVAQLARPQRRPAWLHRSLWKVLPNPFEKASAREAGELLSFLGTLQTKSSVVVR